MREYEKQVFADFKQYANVVETWPLYDSIVVCENMFGTESSVPGWFTTFAAFGARETHTMFKNRTDATAGEAYCNLKAADTLDFAYKIHSFGIEIAGAPGHDVQNSVDGGTQTSPDFIVGQWWRVDMPRHMGIQLRVQQDVRVELPAFHAPPGYGAMGGGYGGTYLNALGAFGEIPYMTGNATSGVPLLANRYPLPEPIGVPRTGSIEAVLHVSEWARVILQSITGPHQMAFNTADGAVPYVFAWSRYVIRVSLFGERLVQQRGQYHR